MIVSLFPTPLSNATTVNGVIVISGRGADNPRVFGLQPSPPPPPLAGLMSRYVDFELQSRFFPIVLETLPDVKDVTINVFLRFFSHEDFSCEKFLFCFK